MPKILLNVKPYKETGEGNCGPASLKIVLAYYGVSVTQEELAKLGGTKKDLGTSAQGLARAAKEFGFKVTVTSNSSFADIEKWLKKGVPVIVDWFTRGGNNSLVADGHYSVVTGLDDQYIYLQDPELGGIRKIKREDFMTVWFDFKGKYIKPNELVIRQIIAVYQ